MATTTVITGANRGIGLHLARLAAERGDLVIAVCRRSSPELESLGVQVIAGIDVTSAEQVSNLAEQLADTSIDILINNAGLLAVDQLESLDFEQLCRQFEVNSLAPLRVTAALLPRLANGARVALITSRMGSIADNGSGGYYGYRMAKAALNIAGVSLAIDLKPRGISVGLLHPGFVRTEMTGGMGNTEPAQAAAELLERINEIAPENSGAFRHANGDVLPW